MLHTWSSLIARLQVLEAYGKMYDRTDDLVPVPAVVYHPFDRSVDRQKMLYRTDILRPARNPVVVVGTLRCLLETGVIFCRQQ